MDSQANKKASSEVPSHSQTNKKASNEVPPHSQATKKVLSFIAQVLIPLENMIIHLSYIEGVDIVHHT